MSRTRTPRDLPAQDPIDRLDESSARLRQVASDLYSADVDEITKRTEVHVHTHHVPHPSQPDGRLSDLPQLAPLPGTPMQSSHAGGIVVGIGGLVSACLAIAKALGWL